MVRQTGISNTLDVAADKAKYDNCAKKLLAYKAVDAWILKCCTREFADYSIDYICEHCLSGSVEVAEHAVHQDHLNRNVRINGDNQIVKMNSESTAIKEQTVYFDVRFQATLPGEKEPITLIINLEIQNQDKPGYALVRRGLYYCARMISEQYGTEFVDEHYEEIQKVYSIWICPSVAVRRKNGILRYHTVEEAIYGRPYVQKEDYDLMEVVILNLGDARMENEYKILNLLNTLFSQEITPDEKKEILKNKFNIATTAELESEVQNMCNLSSAIENKGKEIGRQEGLQEGRQEGRQEGLQEGRQEQAKATAIRMNQKGLPIEVIADSVGFSIETVKEWIAM